MSMLRTLCTVMLVCAYVTIAHTQNNFDFAQIDSFNLNTVRLPSTPAFAVLGVEPSTIATPEDPADILVSIGSATNNLSSLPESYGLTIAPYWMLGGQNITKASFFDHRNIGQNILQSLQLSLAIQRETGQMVTGTDVGLGLRFSIIRGQISDAVDSLYTVSESLLSQALAELGPDPDSVKWNSVRAKYQSKSRALAQQMSNLPFLRTGFNLNAGGGIAYAFPDNNFNDRKVTNWSAWLTASLIGDASLDFLVSSRLSGFRNTTYVPLDSVGSFTGNFTFLDNGGRLVWKKNRFSASLEILYRSTLNRDDIDADWKYDLNLSYQVHQNRALTLALGRDFDGALQRDGNVIAILHFFMGFGTKRNLAKS